jgi:hypothetical protein
MTSAPEDNDSLISQPLSGLNFKGKNQDRRCSLRPEFLVDRAAEAPGERFDDFESAPRTGIFFAVASVRDPAFDERGRRQQFDADQACATTKRVTFCIRDEFRHDQTQSPAALGVYPEWALNEPKLYALAVKF